MSEQDIAAERIRLLRENAKHVGVPIATEHDIYWVCDQLTAAQSRVDELEKHKQLVAARWAVLTSELDKSLVETVERVADDNQRLRELLRECLPIVRHSVDERFNVELPTYQNRLQLRDRIKAAIGDQ